MDTMCPAMNASSVDSCVNTSTRYKMPKNSSTASATAAGQRKIGELNFDSEPPFPFFTGGVPAGGFSFITQAILMLRRFFQPAAAERLIQRDQIGQAGELRRDQILLRAV